MLALVTGASSGIGEALAREHAANGGNLILVARREEKLNAMKDEFATKFGIETHVIARDLSRPEAAREVFDEVHRRELSVDFLINNAGFGGQGLFHEQEWSAQEAMINLNILALTSLTHLFLPEMVQRNSGRILNVASTAAMVPAGPLQTVYFATKHYVLSFSQGIAGELADTNVTITALCPGPIDTEFSKTAGLEKTDLFAKTYSPETVAKNGYRAMLKGKLVQVTGISLVNRLSINVSSIAPRKLALKYIRDMQEVNE